MEFDVIITLPDDIYPIFSTVLLCLRILVAFISTKSLSRLTPDCQTPF